VGLLGAALTLMPGLASAGQLLLSAAGLVVFIMIRFVTWFASWAPSWRVATPTAFEMVSWYVGLMALYAGGRWRRVAILCALLVAGSIGARAALTRLSTTLRVTFLDVGQGDACVVELPHGHVMVVDGGGSFDPGFDPGQEVLAPFLWRRGIRRIDLVVLSHPHPDHANGLPFIVEQFAVGEIWTNGQPSALPAVDRLRVAARDRKVPLGEPRAIELGGVRVAPLGPLDERGHISPDPAWSENDNSLVLELDYAGRRLWFAGDVEQEAESVLAARASPVDLVKVPHHGSRTSSTAALVEALRPRLAVISVGERNRWGFPNGAVVERWRTAGARVVRTDRDGAVTVEVSGKGKWSVDTVR
jgi:competence protein ComEC